MRAPFSGSGPLVHDEYLDCSLKHHYEVAYMVIVPRITLGFPVPVIKGIFVVVFVANVRLDKVARLAGSLLQTVASICHTKAVEDETKRGKPFVLSCMVSTIGDFGSCRRLQC